MPFFVPNLSDECRIQHFTPLPDFFVLFVPSCFLCQEAPMPTLRIFRKPRQIDRLPNSDFFNSIPVVTVTKPLAANPEQGFCHQHPKFEATHVATASQSPNNP